jgi:hypothetical protein
VFYKISALLGRIGPFRLFELWLVLENMNLLLDILWDLLDEVDYFSFRREDSIKIGI